MTGVVNKLAQRPLPCTAIVSQGHSLLLPVRGIVILHRGGNDGIAGLGHSVSTVSMLWCLPVQIPARSLSVQVASTLGYLHHLSLISVLRTQTDRQRQLRARDYGEVY